MGANPIPSLYPVMKRITHLKTYGYLLPGLFFMGIFTFIPVFMSAYLSLFKWNVNNPEPQ